MIKGCNKRVIWIRNTENELFEQAYFILSDSAQAAEKTEGDILREAKRLIDESPVRNYWEQPRAVRKYNEKTAASRTRRGKLLFFALGFALGAIPAVLLLVF